MSASTANDAGENTPLLGGDGAYDRVVPQQEHPIFLQVCHSPWRCISQNVLCYIRGFVLMYLLGAGLLITNFQLGQIEEGDATEHNVAGIVFAFPTVSYALLLAYNAVAFSWTFTHFHFGNMHEAQASVETFMLRQLSPPKNLADPYRRYYFSVFYTVTHCFTLMNAIIFWAVLFPMGRTGFEQVAGKQPPVPIPEHPLGDLPGVLALKPTIDDILGNDRKQAFTIFNQYGVTALVSLLEALVLNSIPQPFYTVSHAFCVASASIGYLIWADVGNALTNHKPYFWMDPESVGSRETVMLYSSAFVALSGAVFGFFYGLVGLRVKIETATREAHMKKRQVEVHQTQV